MPFLLLVAAKCSFASDKLHFGSDFEPLHKEGHVYPMAVVLYDESGLSPFHKNLRDFDLGEIKISIKQNWKDIGVAAVVWEAVRVFELRTFLPSPCNAWWCIVRNVERFYREDFVDRYLCR